MGFSGYFAVRERVFVCGVQTAHFFRPARTDLRHPDGCVHGTSAGERGSTTACSRRRRFLRDLADFHRAGDRWGCQTGLLRHPRTNRDTDCLETVGPRGRRGWDIRPGVRRQHISLPVCVQDVADLRRLLCKGCWLQFPEPTSRGEFAAYCSPCPCLQPKGTRLNLMNGNRTPATNVSSAETCPF